MSAALLKKSLQLVEEDLPGNKNKKKTEEKTKNNTQICSKQKISIEEIRKRKKESSNKAEENLVKLLKLSSKPIDKTTADKLIQRARTGRYVIPEQKPKEEEKSIFTEEDFKAFEREYFCS